ncbi:MAG TPA: biopolymer transporter ExbD [candidate division Zixibacteria bacterium]|nr:biopolymer transporter ExbD [candidate division Zixibacteria bacterium]
MGGEVAERAPKEAKKGLRRPKRRIAIRIDMTPMVDIAFLLLIFYMVTTVFAMPQAMEINLPPAEEDSLQVEVKESNLLTVRVDGEGRYWWNLKRVTPENLPKLIPAPENQADSIRQNFNGPALREILVQENQANPKLNTLILINRDATYSDMVNILDEIDVIERSWNTTLAKQLKKEVSDLTKEDGKFSYRYAIGEWEDADDRKIAAAIQAAQAGGEL